MSEEESKSKKLKHWLPLGGAVIFLISKFPPIPSVLFTTGKIEFLGLKSGGLIAGVLVGYYLTTKPARLQPKQKAAFVITSLVILFFVLTLVYFHILNDAENHFSGIALLFFTLNIFIGILLFLVTPALAAIKTILRSR